MPSDAAKIEERINSLPSGNAFTAGDFLDIASQENANTTLHRLCQSGEIERVLRGVYAKPRTSELLGISAPPNVDEVAQAIARSNRWIIAPTGDTALNRLGLDNQVPAAAEYVSSGPYKIYHYGNTKIRFRHRANRDLIECSPTTMLVTQALRALGRDRVDEAALNQISSRLSDAEAQALYDETRHSTSWIFSFAKQLKEVRKC